MSKITDIKYIDIGSLFHEIVTDKNLNVDEDELGTTLMKMEQEDEFIKFFFYRLEDGKFYHKDNEPLIFNYINKYAGINLQSNYYYDNSIVCDFLTYLNEFGDEPDMEFKHNNSDIFISYSDFKKTLIDSFLNDDDVINELLESSDFEQSFINLKNRVFMSCYGELLEETRKQIKNYKFSSIL